MSSATVNASSSIKSVKINSQNVTLILKKVLRKFTAIKRVTYFEELTDFLTDNFILSLIESELSGENLYYKLKKSKFSRKFEWLNRVEPKSGILLFFQVGVRKERAILIHLSQLRSETSQIRLFSKYEDDSDLFPKNFMDFLEKLICIYKRKHCNVSHLNHSNKIFLYPKNKETMKNVTSLQFIVHLLILFLSDKSSPNEFSKEKPLPCLTRFEYWNFCKTVNLIMADYLPQSKRTNRTDTASPQNNVEMFKSVGTQTWSLESTVSFNRKLEQDLHFAHIEIRKLQQENRHLKSQLLNNHYEPF